MKAQREIEARWINLDPKDIISRLKKIKAKKTGSYFFREWIFAYPEWRAQQRRVRVRTDGTTSWLTYKANPSWNIDSTQEIEVIISSADEMVSMMKAMEIPLLRYQEKKRESFEIGDIVFDVDFWPKIPMVLEIESTSEERVREGAQMIGLDWKDAIFVDQAIVHKKYYDIDLFALTEYKFDDK
jgi:adenylate cyclase class IV